MSTCINFVTSILNLPLNIMRFVHEPDHLITRHPQEESRSMTIFINSKAISKVKDNKLLGVVIDIKLTWAAKCIKS